MSARSDSGGPTRVRTEFTTPGEIADAPGLSMAQRIQLLRQWEQDLRQQMTATREGMAPPEPNRAPETLRTVRAWLRRLEAGPKA
jgi:hypothetical protein